MLNEEKITEAKSQSLSKNFSLYLKVHIMPTLNKPLRGKTWHWVLPLALVGILIVVLAYFFGN